MLILKPRILQNFGWRNHAVFQETRVLLEIQGHSFQKEKKEIQGHSFQKEKKEIQGE